MKSNTVLTIVVVDDEKLIAKNIVKNIQRLGDRFQVIGLAHNGKDALELVCQALPNILFTDIKMPTMDGLELIEQVNSRFPFIKTVIISGYDEFEYAKAALKNHVSNYLLKPINPIELQSSLEKLYEELMLQTEQLQVSKDKLSPKETVNLVKEYIHKNYSKQIGLAEIASVLGFSSSYLTKIFREQLGITPSKYLNEYRINRSKQLLWDSNLSVKDISIQMGFLDQFHFSKNFKHHTNLSPAQYRKELNQPFLEEDKEL